MFSKTSQFDKLLEKATSNLRLDPHWPTIIQICDLIRQGDCPPKHALTSIKKKLQSTNPHISIFALSVLESMVKNCGHLIHDEVATTEFMEDLKEIVKRTQAEPVRQKILELLQIWASAFRSYPKYRAVQEIVTIMKAEGYKFPTCKESDAMFSADTAPKWVNADVCHRCRIGFSVVVRKHHCRACGNVFCSQCTPKFSTLPKFGIEKEVRVCEACYEHYNKPRCTSPQIKHDVESLPAEYITSSLAQQSQIPKSKKTEEELKEEEDMQLALALSQSEAEAREKEKKKATTEIMNITTTKNKSLTIANNDDDEEDPELARYLNRSYWEKKQAEEKAAANEKKLANPDHFRISPAGPPSAPTTPTHQLENGEVSESELNEFVSFLKSQVEIFVNRMKSNSSRGRSISNDSSVQTLFMNVTKNHSTLLSYIHQQDDSRVYYEGLQDKLAQVKDAMMALDALREEHREKVRREAEEAERLRQLQMAQKLEIMRRRKQEYLQYQRQLAIQKVQEQEREMQMRQEQQKQQYLMGSMGVPQHVPWDSNMPAMQNPPAQYGQQFQPLSSGFIQTAGYPVAASSAGVTPAPNSVAVPGNMPPGMMPPHPQVMPHTGQISMQHQDEQSRRAGGQILPQQQMQQPRLMGPQPSQGGSLPVSNQMPQMHPSQMPPANYQGLPLSTILQILPQSRSLVMPSPGGPPPPLSANMNLPPASAPQNLSMPPVPPQVVGMKGRAQQNVANAIPGQSLGLPSGVVIPNQSQSISLLRGSQQRLPPGHPQSMPVAPPNMGMLQSANGPVNGQPSVMMPPSGSQSGISLQQTPQPQSRPQQTQQVEDPNDSKTGELISFD